MKQLKSLFDFFLFSNIFISLCAAVATYQTYLSFGEVNLNYVGFVFCSTFVFYNLQRIVTSKNYIDGFSSARQEWVLRNKKLIIVLSVSAFLISVPLFLLWSFEMILIFGAFSIIASFYFLPKINLRTVPALKAVYIALLWTFSTSFFPLMLDRHDLINFSFSLHPPALFAIVQRFIFLLALAAAFDIRDVSVDKTAGVKTLPVLLGVKATKIICFVLLFIFCGAMPYPLYHTGIALVASAIVTGIIILLASDKRSEYFYSLWMDGMIMLQFLFVWTVLPA